MTRPDDIPQNGQLAEWLACRNHPAAWADDLTGLPWKYIEPVITIAASTRNRPIAALAMAAAYSDDPAFKAAAQAHIAARDGAAGPNRAERRAAAKRGRRG